MVAPLIGLPALLQTLATIGVGGAIGYKAQKDLQPYIKQLKSIPEDMDTPQLKMLRALLLPNQAVAAEVKDLISKSAPELTGSGQVFGPKIGDIEKVQEEIKQVTKPPITSTPIKPITTETFPAEPQQKPEPPVQPEIDMETKEEFPEIKTMPIIYSMEGDKPKFKYPTEDEIKEYINEENEFWEKNAQRAKENYPEFSAENMPQLVEADKHFGAAAYSFQNFDDSKLIYMSPDEYLSLTKKFRPVEGKEQLGSKMNVKNLENILREGGELANIPTLYIKKPSEGLDTFEVVGQEGNHRAKAFKNLGYDKIPVVVEGYTRDDKQKTKNVFPTSIVSFSNYNKEKKEYEQYDSVQTKPTDFYNVLTKEKLFKEEQPQAPALVGTNAQEGGKIYKDITAGISAQKDVVPSLLEQGQLAKPIKDFFESNNQVINYKIGDTIGAYKGDVERSLDIEAFVKPDFKIDDFAEVIKERAKQFNQDAVFVAESVDKNYKNANVGFSLDFGSDLQMQDALSISRGIARLAEIDGFTFKTKNINYGDTSISLPQVEKDSALIEKTLKKYPLTEDIRKAGFIMPDGKMLNFNLRGGSVRDTEHRRVGYLVDDNYLGVHFGPMYDWMIRTGGVRVTGNQNRLVAELAGKPTTTQIRKIVDEYNNNRDKYDSLLIGVTIPGDSPQTSIAPRTAFGEVTGLGTPMANNLRKATFRLPMENFYEVNGEKANANDLYKRIQSTDIVGKTFTGIRQLNLPEFTNLNKDDALKRILNMENKIEEIAQNSGLKVLDKPKTKFYNTKVFTKGKDY